MGNMNNRRLFRICLVIVCIYVFSFFSNFVWEALHGVYLYEAHDFSARRYVPMLIYVSSMDGVLVVIIYLLSSLLVKDFLWMNHNRKMPVLVFILLGLVAAGGIEFWSVFLHDRWTYKPEMPTAFGIGLSPLLQLSTTGLISVSLVKEVLFWKGLSVSTE
jgi:hypothetical protein